MLPGLISSSTFRFSSLMSLGERKAKTTSAFDRSTQPATSSLTSPTGLAIAGGLVAVGAALGAALFSRVGRRNP